MGNFINKTFLKGKCIRALVHYQDRRVRLHWVIPKDNTLTVNKESFTINDKDFVLHKGIPTYLYVSGTPEPMNLYKQPMNEIMTSKDFNVALNANVARQIFEAQGSNLGGMIPLILGFVIIAVMGYLFYTMNQEFTALRNQINQINELLNSLMGG